MATSLNSSSNLPPDIWDVHTSTKRKTPAVRDDWEDDDEEENDNEDVGTIKNDSIPPPPHRVDTSPAGEDEDVNKKIWEAANSQIASPMPTLLSSRNGSVVPPPAAAFQPALRILKRPASSSPSQGSPVTSPPTGETLQDREARYTAARERIFGSDNSENAAAPASVKVIRQPRAPDTAPGKQVQPSGFKGRGGKVIEPARPPVDS